MFIKKLLEIAGETSQPTADPRGNVITVDGDEFTVESIRRAGHIHIEFNGCDNHLSLKGTTWMEGSIGCVFNGNRNIVELGSDGYVGADTTFLFYKAGVGTECVDCTVKIGDRFKLNGNGIILELGEPNTSITIGDDFLCAAGVRMATSDNHPIFDLSTRARVNPPGDIEIGNRVWLCRDVMIMNHAVVSDHTIVAARSVVTKKFVSPNVLLAGVPATIKREGVAWAFELNADCPNID